MRQNRGGLEPTARLPSPSLCNRGDEFTKLFVIFAPRRQLDPCVLPQATSQQSAVTGQIVTGMVLASRSTSLQSSEEDSRRNEKDGLDFGGVTNVGLGRRQMTHEAPHKNTRSRSFRRCYHEQSARKGLRTSRCDQEAVGGPSHGERFWSQLLPCLLLCQPLSVTSRISMAMMGDWTRRIAGNENNTSESHCAAYKVSAARKAPSRETPHRTHRETQSRRRHAAYPLWACRDRGCQPSNHGEQDEQVHRICDAPRSGNHTQGCSYAPRYVSTPSTATTSWVAARNRERRTDKNGKNAAHTESACDLAVLVSGESQRVRRRAHNCSQSVLCSHLALFGAFPAPLKQSRPSEIARATQCDKVQKPTSSF